MRNAELSGEFVWNMATWDLRDAVNISAQEFPGGTDEFELAKLEKVRAGSPGHFGAVAFGLETGLKIVPVHYRTTGDAVAAIISGEVSGAWVSTAVAATQTSGGTMRGLTTTAKARSVLLPSVPTSAESGVPKLDFSSWLGFLAPAGVPPATLDFLSKNVLVALKSPEVVGKLNTLGFSITGADRNEMTKILSADAVRWAAIVKQSGFKGD